MRGQRQILRDVFSPVCLVVIDTAGRGPQADADGIDIGRQAQERKIAFFIGERAAEQTIFVGEQENGRAHLRDSAAIAHQAADASG